VDDVSFEVAPGEIFALLGPNGAGKTTTLRMLAGLIEPSSGQVVVAGEPMTRASASRIRSRIGFLTETPGLWERLSIRLNLRVYAQLYGLPDSERAIAEVLERFGLAERREEPAVHLSKGLKQRVALARTLLHRPQIVLLDEPTSGLDPESARDVRELILQLRTEGRAVLLSTHNLDEVERVADRVGVLRSRLVAYDTPAALRNRLFGARLKIVLAGDPTRFVGALERAGASEVRAAENTLSLRVTDAAADAPALVRVLVLAGAEIQAVIPEEAPLEDVYLRVLAENTP
jgi:ABC-2 type transport system ATP-binding protein